VGQQTQSVASQNGNFGAFGALSVHLLKQSNHVAVALGDLYARDLGLGRAP
jgi:hypothetical protein